MSTTPEVSSHFAFAELKTPCDDFALESRLTDASDVCPTPASRAKSDAGPFAKDEPPRSYRVTKLFRFASALDLLLLSAGVVMAALKGAMLPIVGLLFGDIFNAFALSEGVIETNDVEPTPFGLQDVVRLAIPERKNVAFGAFASVVLGLMSPALAVVMSATLASIALEYGNFLSTAPLADAKFDAVVEEAVALFYASFPRFRALPRAALTIATAPGRVNLIGEHTDYNDGFVLPLALDKNTVIVGVATPQKGDRADGWENDDDDGDDDPSASHVVSAKFPGERVRFPATAGGDLAPGLPTWGNYVRGVTATYLRHTGRAALSVRAAVASRVPFGSGLSSSAALEVAFATFLESAFALAGVSATQKALLCQQAEHEFCNVPCGIMDQFISSCGQGSCALLIDCRAKAATPVPFVDPDVVIVVSNSNVNHELSGGEYKERVQQCGAAVAALQREFPAVTHLRDATMAQLDAVRADLADVVYRRARHVITENERTVAAVALVNAHRYADAGALMFASHASLRDDYEVSTPQLDALVELARACPGVFGARMTGGGFGGCIVVLLRRESAAQLLATLDAGYPTQLFGDHAFPKPTSFITHIGHGAQVLQPGRSSSQ
ncbi:hypothetical protein PybrP1_008803 [[Pythium] brassicae (nom. inval.)]|nr:hypothetical protein PybrP1_008803 [[Pythium] brassicae (nom. inval.)]